MSTGLSFHVSRKEPELIVPTKPTPREIKLVSDLDDQDGFRFHIPVILFYKNVNISMEVNKEPVTLVRKALGKVLEYYYPLSGRLFKGDNNKLILDCNEKGAMFIEADADVTLEQLGGDTIPWPCPYMDEFLHVDPGAGGLVGCPLLLIQVTRLMCGGVVVAVRMNHVLADTVGLFQFLNGLAEICIGNFEPSILPIWKRDHVNARSQPHITRTHPEYTGLEDNQHSSIDYETPCDLVSRSFFFGPKEIRCIRKLCPDTQSFSKFEMIAACVWKSRAISLQNEGNPNQVAILTTVVSIREKHLLNQPNGYYGNTAIPTAVVPNVAALCKYPLGYTLGQLKKAKARVNKEYIESFLDLMVMKRRPKVTSSNFAIGDSSKIRFEKVDFGWGEAVCGGPSFEPTTSLSVFMRCQNSDKKEGIVVPICLPIDKMERFSVEIEKMTIDHSTDDLTQFSSRL